MKRGFERWKNTNKLSVRYRSLGVPLAGLGNTVFWFRNLKAIVLCRCRTGRHHFDGWLCRDVLKRHRSWHEQHGLQSEAEMQQALVDHVLVQRSKEHIYFVGQSLGGRTIQNVAAQRNDEIAGLIVLYGGLHIDTDLDFTETPAIKAHPYNNGEVLFI